MGINPRVEGWQKRLFEYIVAHKETPFSWGTFNCAIATQGALEVVYNKKIEFPFTFDLRGDIEGQLNIACNFLRLEEIPIKLAGVGDIVYIELPNTKAIGFIDLSGTRVRFPAQTKGWASVGFRTVFTSSLYRRAWRV